MQGGPLFLCSRRKKRNEERDALSRKIYLSEGRKCNSGQDRHGRNREKEKIKTGQSLPHNCMHSTRPGVWYLTCHSKPYSLWSRIVVPRLRKEVTMHPGIVDCVSTNRPDIRQFLHTDSGVTQREMRTYTAFMCVIIASRPRYATLFCSRPNLASNEFG